MRSIVLFIIFVSCSSGLAATPLPSALLFSNNGYELYVEPTFSWQKAIIHEYVFDNSYKVSEIEWKLNKLYSLGMTTGFVLYDYFFSVNFSQGISSDIGYADDSDWSNYDGIKTNFSHHVNYLENNVVFDAVCGYKYVSDIGLFLQCYAGYMYYCISMQAQGGYLEYPPGSTKEQLFGVVMQYQEKYYVPYFGIGTGFVSGKKYSMSVFFSYSPIASCSTVDRHFLRDIEFYDEIKNITYLEMGLSVDYRLTDRVVFEITGSYAFIPLSRGDDYYIQTDTGRKSNTFRNISGIKTSFGKVEFSTSTELL